jgi:hypothetical protein
MTSNPRCLYMTVAADVDHFRLDHEQVEQVLALRGYTNLRYEVDPEGHDHWVCSARDNHRCFVNIVMRDIVRDAMLKLLLSP